MPDIVAGIHRAAPAGPDDGQVPWSRRPPPASQSH